MKKPIAKITKENHLNNLINNLPLFTIIYGFQCLLAHFFFREIVNVGDFSAILGGSIIGLITLLYAYDKYHHIVLFEDSIQVYTEVLGHRKTILFDQIQEIIVPRDECDFASLTLQLKDESKIDFLFVDYPLQVKKVILNLKNQKEEIIEERQVA